MPRYYEGQWRETLTLSANDSIVYRQQIEMIAAKKAEGRGRLTPWVLDCIAKADRHERAHLAFEQIAAALEHNSEALDKIGSMLDSKTLTFEQKAQKVIEITEESKAANKAALQFGSVS